MTPPPADGGTAAAAAGASALLYLDASALVPLVVPDPHPRRADAAVRGGGATLLVSDFAAAEVASSVSRMIRTGRLSEGTARAALADFDAWTARFANRVFAERADIAAAGAFLRRLDTGLRTPDALNVAIAQRAGAALLTFDAGMAAGAHLLGVRLAPVPPP